MNTYNASSKFEDVVNRIVPIPKEVTRGNGELVIRKGTKVSVSAPKAAFGPIKTASERISKLFSDCDVGQGGEITVTLTIDPSQNVANVSEEGYLLTVTAQTVDIVGFSERGLLYAVITLQQLCRWENGHCTVPAMTVLDWPDNPVRGIMEESRVGSDMMRREEWLTMLEDLASKKLNTLVISLYGCWLTQYDNQLPQYVYLPIKNRPELKTPKTVKYQKL